ncbi:hypothetical protein KJ780_01015 [Candidatus Micrarchaeota archaeon]|nr:hypothetical protein [Candidatus Micrarchaeota archaeon]
MASKLSTWVSTVLFIFFLLFLSAIVYQIYFRTNLNAVNPTSEISFIPAAIQECNSGTEECITEDGCQGTRTCKGGKWSECIIKKICSPGSTSGCFVNSCIGGYAVCNSCGTAYENCTPA